MGLRGRLQCWKCNAAIMFWSKCRNIEVFKISFIVVLSSSKQLYIYFMIVQRFISFSETEFSCIQQQDQGSAASNDDTEVYCEDTVLSLCMNNQLFSWHLTGIPIVNISHIYNVCNVKFALNCILNLPFPSLLSLYQFCTCWQGAVLAIIH